MKNKYIIKLYHYYLRKKYDNDKIVGIKESEKVLEKSIQLEENKQEIEKGSGESLEKSVTSSLSKKNEALLTGNTSGSMPYIIKEMSPSIQGVVVAARGNITQTKIREISEAVQALFGIEAHKIKVIEKKSQAEEAK